MERRSFVVKSAIISGLALVSSPVALLANDDENSSTIDVSSLLSNSKKVKVNGFTFDSQTKEPVPAKIKVKNGFGLFAKSKEITLKDGKYNIVSSLIDSKINKIKISIEAKGYKTFTGYLYLSANGCNVNSEMWNYNPDFKSEYIPKNTVNESEVISNFNFYLVKA